VTLPTFRMFGAVIRDVVRRAPLAGWIGAIVLGLVLATAFLAPLGGYPIGADVDPAASSRGPSADHWLGTDRLGRDVFWRLLLASRAFVGPGALACAISGTLGVSLGALAGWRQDAGAQVVRAGLGAVASVPALVLVLLGCARYGNGPVQIAVFAGIATAPSLAEAVRSRIERLRHEDFVAAAQAHGLSDLRILVVHLMGIACGRTIARKLTETFGSFVLLEATLAYLGVRVGGAGFGVQEPMPSWGNMMAFEWGSGLTVPFLAPAVALWATVWATAQAARMFAEAEDG
jgi:peptide/nickel transport system permease protein